MATILYNVATDEYFVLNKMSRIEKLLRKFLDNPQSLKFKKIEKILFYLGFMKTQAKGSHVKFDHSCIKNTLAIPIHKNDCKVIYKEKIAKIIKKNFS